jgi:cytochrome P450
MALFQSCFRTFFGGRMQSFADIPGPTPSFPLGTLWDFRGRQPWDVLADYEKKYGGTSLIWEFGKPVVVVSDADMIREVLITKANDYWKDDPSEGFRPVLKVTEFCENGSAWENLRKREPFCIEGFDQWLPTQAAVVRNVVDTHLQKLMATTNPVDLLPVIERMVYDAYNACCVGRQLSDSDYDAFYITSNMATKRMQLPKWMLIKPVSPSFWRAMKQHFGVFGKIVDEAQRDNNPNANDLLHIYLRQFKETTPEQIAIYLGNIHAGGVFSAGTALVNTMYLVSRHPEIAKNLYVQLQGMRQGKPDFGIADVDQCPLLEQTLREAMRFYAPIPMFFRNVSKTKSTQLGKYTLPPNTVVYLMVQGVHRSARYWNDPDRFDPSRFAGDVPEAKALDTDRYLPFGRGPRICVGAPLAMFCMKMMLAGIWSKAKVEIDPKIVYKQFFHCGVTEPKDIMGSFAAHR